jgi:hypothetical protein
MSCGSPQWVAREDVRPGADQFRFRLNPGRYRIEDQLTMHSTPIGCIDVTHVATVRANHTTHVTLDAAFLNAGCGISQ